MAKVVDSPPHAARCQAEDVHYLRGEEDPFARVPLPVSGPLSFGKFLDSLEFARQVQSHTKLGIRAHTFALWSESGRAQLPQVGAAVAVGGGQQVTAGGERDGVHTAAAGIGEGGGQPTSSHVPEIDLAVVIGGGEHRAVRSERHAVHALGARAGEGGGQPAGGHVSNA